MALTRPSRIHARSSKLIGRSALRSKRCATHRANAQTETLDSECPEAGLPPSLHLEDRSGPARSAPLVCAASRRSDPTPQRRQFCPLLKEEREKARPDRASTTPLFSEDAQRFRHSSRAPTPTAVFQPRSTAQQPLNPLGRLREPLMAQGAEPQERRGASFQGGRTSALSTRPGVGGRPVGRQGAYIRGSMARMALQDGIASIATGPNSA